MGAVARMWARYKQPTHPKWRKIGDYILLVTGFVTASLPTWSFISAENKVIIGAITGFVGMTLKFWTNTKGKGPDSENGEETAQQNT